MVFVVILLLMVMLLLLLNIEKVLAKLALRQVPGPGVQEGQYVDEWIPYYDIKHGSNGMLIITSCFISQYKEHEGNHL